MALMKQRPVRTVALVGRNTGTLKQLIRKAGLRIVTKNPDAVISFGGDGTALYAERAYPGIPRLLIRNSPICNLCGDHHPEDAIGKLARGEYMIVEESKLGANLLRGKREVARFDALNDINVHYSPPEALRFRIKGNGKPFIANPHRHDEKTHAIHDVFIGDGAVVTTPHGSTGYFRSITRTSIGVGFAIALNNPMFPHSPIPFKRSDRIAIEIVRGPGVLVADNARPVRILARDRILICASKNAARTIMPIR